MKKLTVSVILLCAASGCSVNYMLSDKPTSNEVETSVEVAPQLTSEQKAILVKERKEVAKIERIKCQDAKLDLLDAEAAKDRGAINRITKRMQQLCQSF